MTKLTASGATIDWNKRKHRGFFAETTHDNSSSNTFVRYNKIGMDEKTHDNILCQLNKTKTENYEPDWEERRFEAAMNFMGNMLNTENSFKAKLKTDALYKELAEFSVMCADALIEELQKER